jgi:hypothetical protein
MKKRPTFFQDTGRQARPFEERKLMHITYECDGDTHGASAAFRQRVRSTVRWFVFMKATSEAESFTT